MEGSHKKQRCTSKDKNQYHLNEYEKLDEEEIEKLISFAKKDRELYWKRGDKVWEHRENPLGISLEH